MAVTVNTSNLTPLQRAAVAAQRALDPTAEGMSDEEFLAAYVDRALDAWSEAVVDEQLPTLRPVAKDFLDVTPEQREELLSRLAQMRAANTKPATGA